MADKKDKGAEGAATLADKGATMADGGATRADIEVKIAD